MATETAHLGGRAGLAAPLMEPEFAPPVAPLAQPVTTTHRIISYTYDSLYRLTDAEYSSGEYYQYAYDSVGNRLSLTTGGGVVNYQYDAANRLTSVNGQAYTWDDNGNLLNDGLRSYSYDHANRLIQVVSGTLTTEFTYNGAGDRVRKTVDGVETRYTLDPAAGLTQVLQETTAGQTTSYLYGHDLLAQYDSGTWAYHVNDGLGSVRQLADAAGEVQRAQSYDPFGNLLSASGSVGSAYGYTGEQEDASMGLVFLRARYYQPATGRFLGKDPFPGFTTSPQTLNVYQYTTNNAVNRVDPSGYQGAETVYKWVLIDSALLLALLKEGAAIVAVVGPYALVAIPIAAFIYVSIAYPIPYEEPIVPPRPAPAPPGAPPTEEPTEEPLGPPPAPPPLSPDGTRPMDMRPQPQPAPAPEPPPAPQPRPLGDPYIPPCPPVPTTTPEPDKVRLYHGAKSPASSFVVIDASRGGGQFGRGFYTSPTRDCAVWFAENYAKGPGPEALVWADVPRQWIDEARRLTRYEYHVLTYRDPTVAMLVMRHDVFAEIDWDKPIPKGYEYLITSFDIIYGPIQALEYTGWLQYKFNPRAQVKLNSVQWRYEPLMH